MPKNPAFDTYIAKAAPFAQPILKHVRALVHDVCPEAGEEMKWSHPCYTYHGKLLCSMPAFKAHMAVGFWHQELEKRLEAEGVAAKKAEGAGLLGRITKLADLPGDATLKKYFRLAMELIDAGTPARVRSTKKKPEAKVPPDLAARLKKNKRAATTWENFSPSHRREYVEWITEAKREETREQRLETTLEWLADGKARNWKYEKC